MLSVLDENVHDSEQVQEDIVSTSMENMAESMNMRVEQTVVVSNSMSDDDSLPDTEHHNRLQVLSNMQNVQLQRPSETHSEGMHAQAPLVIHAHDDGDQSIAALAHEVSSGDFGSSAFVRPSEYEQNRTDSGTFQRGSEVVSRKDSDIREGSAEVTMHYVTKETAKDSPPRGTCQFFKTFQTT